MDISGKAVYGEQLRFDSAGKAGEGNGVILRKAGDVFDDDIVAAAAQIDTVGILDDHLLVAVCARQQTMHALAVFVDAGIVRFELDVADVSEAAEDEVERPPALVADIQSADLEVVHIVEKQDVVDGDVRAAVLAAVALGETVVIAAVEDNAAAAFDDDIAVASLDGFARIGSCAGVAEHIAEGIICHHKVTVFENEREIGGDKNGFFDFVIAGDGRCAGTVFTGRIDQRLNCCASVFHKFHNLLPLIRNV